MHDSTDENVNIVISFLCAYYILFPQGTQPYYRNHYRYVMTLPLLQRYQLSTLNAQPATYLRHLHRHLEEPSGGILTVMERFVLGMDRMAFLHGAF